MRDDIHPTTEPAVPATLLRRGAGAFRPRALPGAAPGAFSALTLPRPQAAPERPAAPPPQPQPTPEPAPAAPAITPEELDRARDAARAEGAALARAEAEAELSAARDLFVAAAARLDEGAAALETSLADVLQQAVFRLASERAGMAIDAAPEPFLHRIAVLAEGLEGAAAGLAVALNPEDHARLASLLGDAAPPLCRARLIASDDLSRGDVVLRGAEIAVEDLLLRGAD